MSGKVIYFPETVNPFNTGDFQCFLDGDLHNHGVVESSSGLLPLNQPFCDETTFEAFLPRTELKQEPCEDQLLLESRVSALFGNLAFFQAYYGAEYCDTLNEWLQRPGFLIPSHYPESYLWPTLDVSELSCSNGKPPTDASNLNPAGVLALCDTNFEAWFSNLVPPGPAQQTAVADATLDRSQPNLNDGANPRLLLVGNKRRVVIAFDPEALQGFLDQHDLDSARLVLSGVDHSTGKAPHWLQAIALEGSFVEGNGNRAESDRGSGSGATYACAEDAEISDDIEECIQDWPRRFDRGRGTTLRVPDGFTGKLSFDVSEDVEKGASAWVIRQLGGGLSTAYHARESAQLLDDPSLAPTLILTTGSEDGVVAEADSEVDGGSDNGR